MSDAYINKIATALPPHDVHQAFGAFAQGLLKDDPRKATLFGRMAEKSGIGHRFSYVTPLADVSGADLDGDAFYRLGAFPTTARRMQAYEKVAPLLATDVVEKLLAGEDRAAITHLIVTSCTGFYAPGLDLDLVERCGLRPDIERSTIGFMGCYAAINALKSAHHIVRSMPDAVVLILSLELCTLHLQETQDLEQMLSYLLFADGCAACLVSAKPVGLAMSSFLALRIPDTSHLITWKIRKMGFDMYLSGQVPTTISRAMKDVGREITHGEDPLTVDLWAVHPGGRTVLDAVEKGLGLHPDALCHSREVLAQFGNMSSATVMFVLHNMMRSARSGQRGCAMSFGPGVTAETMLFHAA